MPRFAQGDNVRILDLDKDGHIRIPWYVRLREGVVERYCGAYPNPEERAYARPGLPPVDLYRVRLLQSEIWSVYRGPSDTLEIEVYDHWLEPAPLKRIGKAGRAAPSKSKAKHKSQPKPNPKERSR